MSVRTILKKNQGPIAVLCLVALGAGAWMIVQASNKPVLGPPTSFWVYDLDADALLTMGPESFPPIALPGGGTGYRATVVSCTDCGDSAAREVAVLMKYSDEAKAAYERGVTEKDAAVVTADEAEMVATVEMAKLGEWLPSVEARDRLLEEFRAACGGETEFCTPTPLLTP